MPDLYLVHKIVDSEKVETIGFEHECFIHQYLRNEDDRFDTPFIEKISRLMDFDPNFTISIDNCYYVIRKIDEETMIFV